MSKLSFAHVTGTSKAGVFEQIVFEQAKTAIRKYVLVCESLNVDCLYQHSFIGVAILMSRYSVDIERSWNLFLRFCDSTAHDLVEMPSADDINDLASQFSNADWKHLFENVEISSEISEDDFYNHPILQILLKCMQECGLPFPPISKVQVVAKFFLTTCPSGTPAARMCENYMSAELQKYERAVPHDLELRVMKCLSMFHDYKVDTIEMQNTHYFVLERLHILPNFLDSVRLALNERAENVILFQSQKKNSARPRLSDYVQQVQKSQQHYDSTFKHWTAILKFGINTSVRMQRILYFLRVQTDPIDRNVLTQHFIEKLVDNVMSSVVDTIDPEPIISCIKTIRTYKHRIQSLISFRTECLCALPVSIRNNLKAASVLQLYIAAFQHESIRSICLQHLLQTKISYNLQKNLLEFTKNNAFEIEPVIHALIDALYALADKKTLGSIELPSNVAA